VLIAGELFARYGLGLGDPPLTVVDPEVGYMFAPNQDVYRFGNHVMYNAFSMRSESFPPHKSSRDELRVMVIGDSVVNGGALTDQNDLATEHLKRRLREKLGRQVIVGNISAGGWSPSNEWNYVRRFGLFDADVVVIVESSHDARGDEGFGPQGVDFPTRRPVLALSEIWERYLPRYFPMFSREKPGVPGSGASIPDDTVPLDTDDLKQLIGAARGAGAEVVVALHPDAKEFAGEWEEGHALMRQAAEEAGVETLIELKPHYQQAGQKGVTIHRDGIHLSPAGHGVLADVLEPVVYELLAKRVGSEKPRAAPAR